jgi:pimeloyl-ACP methyl ester carboxylesterase
VIPASFTAQAELAFPERVGPFAVEGAGHFLQGEKADVLNQAVR